MSFSRVKAILAEDLFITRKSLEVIMDVYFFVIMDVVAFGFISIFLSSRSENSFTASFLLMGALFWEVIRVGQYSITVGSFWEIWSRNLSNLFISPITFAEYLTAHVISSLTKAISGLALAALIAKIFFNFNILDLGLPLLTLAFVNLTIFSWTMGVMILGMVFRFGTRIQALGWALIFLFQPIMAVYFPVRILPGFMQQISLALPPSYIFEALREKIALGSNDWRLTQISLVLNIIYFILSLLFFHLMFLKSKDTGQFARNEG